jgi:hypothetical protein
MRTAFLFIVASLGTLASAGCGSGDASKGKPVIFKTAEAARAHLLATKITGDRFELAIANDFTFLGRPDPTGAGMAFVVDAILAQGYGPDGFEQREGYRLYRYKPLK